MIELENLSAEQRETAERILAQPDQKVSLGHVATRRNSMWVIVEEHAYPVGDGHDLITDNGQPIIITLADDKMPVRYLAARGPGKWDVLPMATWPVPASNLVE